MKYRYRSEEEMKDSGVEWLGRVPRNWSNNKIAREFEIIGSGTTPLSSNMEYYNGHINWLLTGDLNDDYIYDTSRKITKKALKDYSTLKIYTENSLIIAMYGATIGKVGITKINTTTNQACCVLSKPINLNIKFIYYWFLANKNEIINLGRGGGQPNISQDLIKSLKFSKPSCIEQNSIVKFLDQKTAQFDSIISKKEALIQKLQEAKKSLISEVVTGKVKVVKTCDGYELVERDRDEMKDSGVEWLEKIPVTWCVSKLKHLVATRITDGPHETPTLVDEGVPFLSAEAIVDSKISIPNMRGYITEEQYDIYAKKSRVCREDILFCKSGSTTGKSALVKSNIKFAIWSPLAIIRANTKKINIINLFYVIQSSYFRVQVENYWSFGTQPNIGMGTLENLYIPYSTNNQEQHNICEYLEKNIESIDRLINKVINQINYLKEAKQSLISEAVTGKIEILD